MKQKENSTVHVFLGDDTKRSREALQRAVEEAKVKDPSVLVSRFDDVSFDPVLLCEALVNQSIFGGRNIVVFDGILDCEEGEEFYQNVTELKETPNSVFIRETSPSKKVKDLLREIGSVEEFLLRKTFEKKKNFSLADAVAMRDKRSAWVEFVKQKREGVAMEEVHGMIFWTIKALYLCTVQTKDEAQRSGVKEYTYRMYQPRAKNFLVRELEGKLGELKDMYHRAHWGDGDLGILLEQFLLKL